MTAGHWAAWRYGGRVAGLILGYCVGVVPGLHTTGWTLLRWAGFILCLAFGVMMDACREQLELLARTPAMR
jgi:hypothetical protein